MSEIDLKERNDELVERIEFLKRRLERILSVSREHWRPEGDRLGVCESEAEHCLGQARDW